MPLVLHRDNPVLRIQIGESVEHTCVVRIKSRIIQLGSAVLGENTIVVTIQTALEPNGLLALSTVSALSPNR